ncbi:MAG: iron-containing alcohol dehydrogenase [Balneolaceae bacterium]|nr:MAG: iron-containing alcohol dehydrogenase [Balneolaceae bacterium]
MDNIKTGFWKKCTFFECKDQKLCFTFHLYIFKRIFEFSTSINNFCKAAYYRIVMTFTYRSHPMNILFGKGSFKEIIHHLKEYTSCFVIASDRMDKQVRFLEKSEAIKSITRFSKVIQHVPQTIVEEAENLLSKNPTDVIIAIGGGSGIGLAKALALKTKHPIIAVPSTYSGSEQTNIWGISSEEGKTTGKSLRVLPKLVIYDSEFTQSLPVKLAVKSGMNAMAHLMEAVYAPDGNPITRNIALLGIEYIKKGLNELGDKQKLTQDANENLLMGAFIAGRSLCEVSMSLHHKTAHVLGGSFGMDHASVHTVIQPYVLEYQWDYLSDEIRDDFTKSLGPNPSYELKNLAKRGGAETELKSIGFKREDITKAVKIILSKPYANVAPLEEKALFEMLEKAYTGKLKQKPEPERN